MNSVSVAFILDIRTDMLSSLLKPRHIRNLPWSIIKQQYLYVSKFSSASTGDTSEDGNKNIHEPQIDASQQSGTKSKEERIKWQKAEQGLSSDIQTRIIRKPQNEQERIVPKPSH